MTGGDPGEQCALIVDVGGGRAYYPALQMTCFGAVLRPRANA